jgi:threonine dehydrogenase-like Zn-dependent dehydrogenase
MKALAWFGKKDVRVIDTPIPDITQPDDVIVKVTGTTIWVGQFRSPFVATTSLT